LAITSESKPPKIRYNSTQLRYALVYIIVTAIVLLFLNIYSSGASQQIFYQSKKASMLEKCQLAATEIASLDVLNTSTISNAVSQMGGLHVSRLVITDLNGICIYDSMSTESSGSSYILLPEVVKALESNDVFTWQYQKGAMESHAAMPVYSYGTLIGCVYIMEYDAPQGALIHSLGNNILTITFMLELVVILFSFTFYFMFTKRLRRIFTSMRIIRGGDYSHKVVMGGNDELTTLGNEFNDLTEKLQTSENKRRQFVSDASHELKTPLASIKLLTDSILQNDMDVETIHEFVEDIGNEADRLNRMAQKLLSLTKIESQQDGDCEVTFMAPTVHRVVKMLSGIAEKNQITIQLELDGDATILILEDDLYQITFNLVENGIKYNRPGGSLTISLFHDSETVCLQVTDTGVGIPKDAITHIFERFYRVDKARSRKSGGSGLGLAIVRNMVERNQGTIQVESQPNVGTTFTVSFPAFECDMSTLEEVPEE